jgi:hypothetical protein
MILLQLHVTNLGKSYLEDSQFISYQNILRRYRPQQPIRFPQRCAILLGLIHHLLQLSVILAPNDFILFHHFSQVSGFMGQALDPGLTAVEFKLEHFTLLLDYCVVFCLLSEVLL